MLLGSYFSAFCLGIWLYEKSERSITDLSRLTFLSDLPGILLMPLSGVIIDRFSRKLVLGGSVIIYALSALALYAVSAYYAAVHNGHIAISYLLTSVGNAFYSPIIVSSISMFTTADRYTRVNGLFDAADGIAQLLSPIVGGLVMHNSDIHLAITINAVLHVVPLILVPFISFKSLSGKHGADDEGSAFAWSELFIGARLISELNMVSVLVLNVINYLVILNVMELFMPITLNVTTASVHGVISSVQGVSMILGGVLSGRLSSTHHLRMVTRTTALQCLLTALLALQFNSVANIALLTCLIMLLDPFIASNQRTVWQQSVPVSLHGRVFSYIKMMESIVLFIVALGLGPLTDDWLTPWAAKYLSEYKNVTGVHLAVLLFALLQGCTLLLVKFIRRSKRSKLT
jgi:MFS family permease